MRASGPNPRRFTVICALAIGLTTIAGPASAQVLLTGSSVAAETDLSPEQEQNLLGEYWTAVKRYRLDPAKTVAEFLQWTRDRQAKAQSIQFQPAKPLPEYIKSRAEWAPETLRLAAMLHSDLALEAYKKRNGQDFDFHFGPGGRLVHPGGQQTVGAGLAAQPMDGHHGALSPRQR